MPLSFTCPQCRTRHTNIDKRLYGQQVECFCGKVIQLGAAPETPAAPTAKTVDATPGDTHLSQSNSDSASSSKNRLMPIDPDVNVQAKEAIHKRNQ